MHAYQMNKPIVLVFLYIFIIPQFKLSSQEKNCVSVSQETQVLRKGVKSTFKCDIFYNKEKDEIITHHYFPAEFVKMSNRFGEMKIYFPKTNTVSFQQDQSYSSNNELLYYFVNNKLTDLGLSKEGFKLINTTHEEDMLVTTWQAPVSLKVISQIKIVFREMVPIYSEYRSINGEIMKKIYYGRYTDFKNFRIPLRITEISFDNKTDSVISLSVFSNVKISDFADSSYFNFKIPDDAKISK